MTNLEIEAFQAILKYGNISKAAEYLFISQPALSLRIKNLEDELGCNLFIRKKGVRNIELTDAGKRFVSIAERWNGFWSEVQSLPSDKILPPFRVSALNSISTGFLPEVLEDYSRSGSVSGYEAEDLASYASYDAIESKRIDLALITDRRYSISAISHKLFTEKLFLVCNKNSSLPDVVSCEDLDTDNEIYTPWFLEFEQWHRLRFGAGSRPKMQIQILYMLIYFLKQPESWAIVPSTTYELLKNYPYVVKKHFSEDIPERSVYYLVHENTQSEIISGFVDSLGRIIDKMDAKGIVKKA